MMRGDHVSASMLNENDLNITYIYDKRAAYAESNKYTFHKYSTALSSCNNYFPGFHIMSLLCDKPKYYTYLHNQGVRVNPFMYIDASQFLANPYGEYQKIKSYLQKKGIDHFIIKPRFASCSAGLHEFTSESTDAFVINTIEMVCRQYPGVMVMKYIQGFTTTGEYKVYFLNGKPHVIYHVIFGTADKDLEYHIIDPSAEHVKNVVSYAEEVYSKLPKPSVQGVQMPFIYIRIDIACCLDNKCCSLQNYFVNEIEFTPSLITDAEYKQIKHEQTFSRMDIDVAEATKQAFEYYLSQPKNEMNGDIWSTWIIYVLICILLISLVAIGYAVYNHK
jgi:hypothetical protein